MSFGIDDLLKEVNSESPRTATFDNQISVRYLTLYKDEVTRRIVPTMTTHEQFKIRDEAKQNAYFACVRWAFGAKK